MASVVGLLEERELAARQRMESLREAAERILAELAAAESDWERWVIARERVGQVLSAPCGQEMPTVPEDKHSGQAEPAPVRTPAVGSVVPVRREGLDVSALAPDYQRIVNLLADHQRSAAGEAMGCQEMAAVLGLEVVAAKVEGVRSKAKRLVERGWLAERVPGRFSIAGGPGGGS
ncbi:hypothetical protein ABTY61_28105 [Kitasatospora sp. NPDC096128]|uniref:hypothetical protein n=1 Tax=Kitasatospora sp. NPDC096128 TaxID=3155547 RepID=UPI0033349C2B